MPSDNVIGYIRVSTSKQAYTEALLQQEHRVKMYGVDEVFSDVESGSTFVRSGYLAMVDRIKLGYVRKVVVTRLDRIGRSLVGVKSFIDLCRQHKVELVALDEKIDSETVAGRFHINMLASFGEMELERIRERILHGHKYRQSRGLPYKACFGYLKEGDRLVPHTAPFICHVGDRSTYSRWDLAKAMVACFLARETLQGAIKEMVLHYGFSPIRTTSGLHKWMCNPALRGIVAYKKEFSGRFSDSSKWEYVESPAGTVATLIGDQEWALIEKIFKLFAENKGVKRAGAWATPFSSLCKCGRCGSTTHFTVSGSKKARGFQCSAHRMGMCDNKKWVNEKKVYRAAFLALKKRANAMADDLNASGWVTKEEECLEAELRILREQFSLPPQRKDELTSSPSSEVSRHIIDAISNIAERLAELKEERISKNKIDEASRQELRAVFAQEGFYDYLRETKSVAELREFYRRFIGVIWLEDGEVTAIHLLV